MDLAILSASGPMSSEKFHAMDQLEREIQSLEEYRPPSFATVYSNRGYLKDWLNVFGTGQWTYKSDPTTILGVMFLSGNPLNDGYYAYAYRVSDNKIAVHYTGSSTTNAVAHSHLASGGDVYAAGMLRVSNGEIVEVNSASGHYLPHPKIELDNDCLEIRTQSESLEHVKNKLESLGYDTSSLALNPFRSPTLDRDKIECGQEKMRRNGLRIN